MRVPGLFIGSSGRAKPLASALRSRLKGEGIAIDIQEWWVKTFEPGTETLSALIEACKKCDFATILFTADDLQLKEAGRQMQFDGKKGQFVARDNCVFEAGLFMGGLGLEPKRCFILSSLKKEDLPSDLQGLTYLPLKVPADLTDARDCQANVEAPAVKILVAIHELGLCERPVLSFITMEDLMEMERPAPAGGNLVRGSVVTSSAEPLELDYGSAVRVMQNMKEGIDYIYFLPADPRPEPIAFICEMFQLISMAGLAKGELKPWLPGDRLKIIEARPMEVSGNLEVMRSHFGIYFLPHRLPTEFRVHNAGSEQDARCYLRHSGEGFVRWSEGRRAADVADQLLNLRDADQEGFILRSTREFDLYAEAEVSRKMRAAFSRGMEKRFPSELQARVKGVCFGEKQAQEAAVSGV